MEIETQLPKQSINPITGDYTADFKMGIAIMCFESDDIEKVCDEYNLSQLQVQVWLNFFLNSVI